MSSIACKNYLQTKDNDNEIKQIQISFVVNKVDPGYHHITLATHTESNLATHTKSNLPTHTESNLATHTESNLATHTQSNLATPTRSTQAIHTE